MVALFAVLYREADHGHLTIPAAVALLVGFYLLTSVAGMAVFLKLALPPVAEQTQRLERALDHQVEVNRRQHDFLIHVHHELRTPATIVLGAPPSSSWRAVTRSRPINGLGSERPPTATPRR